MRTSALVFNLIISFLFPLISNGQERCHIEIKNESPEQFEEWINQKRKTTALFNQSRLMRNALTVRVVVHIIHKGEATGVGTNISDAQVLSQLEVLNKDFNRFNVDALNTPGEFRSVAGSMVVQFVLSAVNRVQGSKPSWTVQDNTTLKAQSYWPAEDYLNIWVCDLTDYYGYTQFPTSSLPGLDYSPTNRLTDGIIISYKAFGSKDYGNFDLRSNFNRGRTTVHEVGHFLGLRHIWGDQTGCSGTDYVDDTPVQSDKTFGCPSHPQSSCASNKMFQNFMDFTDDACMNLFTQGQVNRMITVLENSPRRASLLLPLNAKGQAFSPPKIFSPNGDGINDFWIWNDTYSYRNCTLSIFDSSAKKILEMKAYDNSWSGRGMDGQTLDPGAYYYVLRCDGQEEITGSVRLLR